MAKATRLPSGNWRCRIRKTINGVTTCKSFTASTKKEAEYLASAWLYEENETTHNLTLKTACERYIEAKSNSLSPTTIKSYKIYANRYLKPIMDKDIDKITREAIQIAFNEEAATLSPKSMRNLHGLISAVFKMFRPGFILNTTLPQKKKVEMYIPTDADIQKLLKAIEGTYLEVPVLLAAFGPLRRGEIFALTSDDVKGNNVIVNKACCIGEDGNIIVKTPKNYSSNRVVYLPDFVINKIKDIEGPLVTCHPNSLSKAFSRALKENGIPHFRFHDLRHYNVSICKAMNVPDEYIMARGGWSTNYTMNNVYAHTLNDVKDAITTKITDHFSSLGGHEIGHES